MGQRITRAKAKIKAARIPYRVPSAEDLPARVSGVLAVLFLVFNEGYLATGPDTDPVRHDLTAEAIRLTRLIRALMPEDGEVAGLLALMLLTEAAAPPGFRPAANWSPSTSRTVGPGTRRWSPRAIGWCASAWPPGWLRVATRSSPRSTPCTPPPAMYTTPTGRRSSPLRPARPPRPLADHRPQPGHRGRRARRPGGGTGGRRPSRGQVGRLSRLPCDPRRPAAPAGPQSEVTRGV